MSGADDQRGTEPDQCRYCPNDADRDEAGFLHCIECGWTDNPGKVVGLHETIDRLRAELAETRDRRDYLQGQLDIIYDAEYSRNDALLRRIEKMGAAGDALAGEVTAMLTGPVPDSGDWWSRLAPLVDAWRSVRGDAPTQPPAPMPYAWGGGDGGRYFPTVEAPAVTRTDGQPPADDTGRTSVCDELHLDADAPASAVVDRLRLLKSRYEQLSEAAGHEVPVDGLTAEQYRHIYTDLIRGLAVDLGLDPEKAGGGSVTAAVRRLVAGVSVPQKSTESPDGDQ